MSPLLIIKGHHFLQGLLTSNAMTPFTNIIETGPAVNQIKIGLHRHEILLHISSMHIHVRGSF